MPLLQMKSFNWSTAMNVMLPQAASNSKPTHGNMEYTSCMCRCTKSVPQVSCTDCSVISTGCYPRSTTSMLLGLKLTLPVALFRACRRWIVFLDVPKNRATSLTDVYLSIPIASCLWDGVNLPIIDEMLNNLLWLIRICLCCVLWQLWKDSCVKITHKH